MEPTWVMLNVLLVLGCFAVCLAFVGLLPGVGQMLATMWLTVMGEQVATKGRGQASGTDMDGINT